MKTLRACEAGIGRKGASREAEETELRSPYNPVMIPGWECPLPDRTKG